MHLRVCWFRPTVHQAPQGTVERSFLAADAFRKNRSLIPNSCIRPVGQGSESIQAGSGDGGCLLTPKLYVIYCFRCPSSQKKEQLTRCYLAGCTDIWQQIYKVWHESGKHEQEDLAVQSNRFYLCSPISQTANLPERALQYVQHTTPSIQRPSVRTRKTSSSKTL